MSSLSAGLVLAAAVLFLPALSGTARADCQPAAADNGTVNCTTAGGTQTTTVGTGAENNVTVTVQPGAAIAVGADAIGISLQNGNLITNFGAISAGDAGGFSFAGGIFLTGNDNVVVNNGSIVAGNAAANGLAFGILAFGDNTSVTNNSSIVVGNGDPSGLFTTAFGNSVGISVGSFSQVVNNGSIIAGNFANAIFVCCSNTVINSASGLIQVGDDSVGIIAGGDSNTITNAGQIVVGNGTAYFAIGIMLAGANSTATNTGTIRGGDFSIGMAVDDTLYGAPGFPLTGNTLINAANGVIQLGASSIGIAALEDGSTVQNFGTISVGATGRGIVAGGDNSTVLNAGTIVAGPGGTGIDIIVPFSGPAAGAGTAVTNSGTIIAGAGGTGVNFTDSGTLTNTGLIRAIGDGTGFSGYSVFTCNCTTTIITNFGTLDGKIQAEGISTTFVNRGLIQITDSDAVQPIGPFNFNVSDINGGGGGSFQQTAEGTLSLRIKPGAPAPIDSLLGDTVTLAGTLRAAIQPGLYANTTISDTAVSLTGNGAANITTTFDRFVSSSPFFTVTPIYDSNDPSNWNFLTLQLDRLGFGSVPGLTRNQTAVGNALEPGYSTTLTGNAATFYGNLLAATSVNVLDNLSGEGTTAAQNAAFGVGSQFNNAMQNQGLSFNPNANGLSVTVPATAYAESRVARGHEAFASLNRLPVAQDASRWRIWTAGFGATQSLRGEGDPGSSSQSVRSAGGVLGADWQIAPDFRVGAAVGASESSFSVASLSTNGRVSGGHVGLYAVKTWNAYYAAASVSYARFDNSTNRSIIGIGPTEQASGRFTSDQFSARFEAGWKQAYAGVNVTPFVAVEPAVLWQRGFTETGADVLGLTVASRTATSLPTFVGVQVDSRYLTSYGAVFAPYARVSWVHEFEPDRRVTATFITVPGATFTVDGARSASDAARLDAGARLTFHGVHTLFANFSGEWSDRTQSYSATGGLRAAW